MNRSRLLLVLAVVLAATRRSGHKRTPAIWMLAAAVVLLVGSSPAPAAFPGANGKIAFSSTRDDNTEVYVMDAGGTNQTNLTANAAYDADPSWSPDGTKIAFESNRDGNHEIYVMNADGGSQTNLTTNAAGDYAPSWSPDGTKIAFVSSRAGNDEIYVMNADGGNQTRLTTNVGDDDEYPSWSPDGTKIAFDSDREGTYQIYVMNADGGNQTRLTTNTAWEEHPTWSPDGTKIAFTSDRNNPGYPPNGLYVMNADGGNQMNLTTNTDDVFVPCWSPDGTKIAFTDYRGSNYDVYVIDAGDGSPTRLTTDAAFDDDPSWQSIDTTPPDTTISAHPAVSTSSTSASFSFSSSESVSSFECQLDAGAWSACTSPKAYSGLARGSHAFQVRAIDAASNIDLTPASYSWTVVSSPTSSGKIVSCKLSKTSFPSSQAGKVKLTCKFSPKSKVLKWVLSLKQGKKRAVVKRVSKTGIYKAKYTTTVTKLFAGKRIKSGQYRLKLSSDNNSKTLKFRVTRYSRG